MVHSLPAQMNMSDVSVEILFFLLFPFVNTALSLEVYSTGKLEDMIISLTGCNNDFVSLIGSLTRAVLYLLSLRSEVTSLAMEAGFVKLLIFIACTFIPGSARKCTTSLSVRGVDFSCDRISSLGENLERALWNTTSITVQSSKLIVIPSKSFIRFSTTLKSLDIHESDIRTIEAEAFWALLNLEKLSLWGNNLTWIPADWFIHLTNLRTLDLSFNRIYGIDFNVYYKMPYLSNLYIDNNNLKQIDYNLFPIFTQLRVVEFGKNPWNWMYRALLAWQLDNQRVDYHDSWDDWGWMSDAIQECQNEGYGVIPDTKLLICGLKKLLEFKKTVISASSEDSSISLTDQNNPSFRTFTELHQCVKRNANANGDELLLKLMEVIFHELLLTDNPVAMFHR